MTGDWAGAGGGVQVVRSGHVEGSEVPVVVLNNIFYGGQVLGMVLNNILNSSDVLEVVRNDILYVLVVVLNRIHDIVNMNLSEKLLVVLNNIQLSKDTYLVSTVCYQTKLTEFVAGDPVQHHIAWKVRL